MSAILAIDTATNACSAALWVDGVVVASRFEPMIRGHAERLIPMIGEVAEQAGRPIKDIDLTAVTVGPGAFTGMRVGLAAARGFALSAGVSCLGMTTLEVIAAEVVATEVVTTGVVAAGVGDPPGAVMVVIDSKRADIYAQTFDAYGEALDRPAARAPEALVDAARAQGITGVVTLAGDGASRAGERLAAAGYRTRIAGIVHPNAAVLAEMAAARWHSGLAVARPVPLYLRPPDAVIPKHGGRLRP